MIRIFCFVLSGMKNKHFERMHQTNAQHRRTARGDAGSNLLKVVFSMAQHRRRRITNRAEDVISGFEVMIIVFA